MKPQTDCSSTKRTSTTQCSFDCNRNTSYPFSFRHPCKRKIPSRACALMQVQSSPTHTKKKNPPARGLVKGLATRDYARPAVVHKLPRNWDPSLYPLVGQREYVRAKHLLGSLYWGTDGVYCMTKHPTKLSVILSG